MIPNEWRTRDRGSAQTARSVCRTMGSRANRGENHSRGVPLRWQSPRDSRSHQDPYAGRSGPRAVPEQTKMRRSKLKCSTEQSSICASLSAFCALVPRSLSLFHRVPSCSIMEGHVPCWCRYLSRVSARPSVVASATTHPSCLSRTDELRHALDRQTMTLSALSAKLSVSYSSLVEMWAQIHSSSRLNR